MNRESEKFSMRVGCVSPGPCVDRRGIGLTKINKEKIETMPLSIPLSLLSAYS